MSAVCGIGRPSGRRKSAVTANQSASPPITPASATARIHAPHQVERKGNIAIARAAAASSTPSASRRGCRGPAPLTGLFRFEGLGSAVAPGSPRTATGREKDPAPLDVPDTARRETHHREEIRRQEEQRVERLVVRVAALDEQVAQLVLAAGHLVE